MLSVVHFLAESLGLYPIWCQLLIPDQVTYFSNVDQIRNDGSRRSSNRVGYKALHEHVQKTDPSRGLNLLQNMNFEASASSHSRKQKVILAGTHVSIIEMQIWSISEQYFT